MDNIQPNEFDLKQWARQQEQERETDLVELEAGRQVSKKIWVFVSDIAGTSLHVEQTVFLSYRSADTTLVQRCAEELTRLGIQASRYDPSLPWSDPVGEIGLRIAVVQAVVRVGEALEESPWIEAELKYARSRGVPILRCPTAADATKLPEAIRASTRGELQPVGGESGSQLATMAELMSAISGQLDKKRKRLPTYGDLGTRLMEEESRLKEFFMVPLQLEHANPSNRENRVIKRTFPSIEDAWTQSPVITDLFSASYWCMDGNRAIRPLDFPKSKRQWWRFW
jgi:hypothetical protein